MSKYIRQNRGREWFGDAWKGYLSALDLRERNLRRFLHCTNPREDECLFNPHTDLCKQYKSLLKSKPHLQEVEPLYREWRRYYLVAPKRPQFAFPSAKDLPMPKIFGRGWFEVDFKRSVLRLRLEDMKPGDYLSFAFQPWPN